MAYYKYEVLDIRDEAMGGGAAPCDTRKVQREAAEKETPITTYHSRDRSDWDSVEAGGRLATTLP